MLPWKVNAFGDTTDKCVLYKKQENTISCVHASLTASLFLFSVKYPSGWDIIIPNLT